MSKSNGAYGRRGKLKDVDKGVRDPASTFGKVRNLTYSIKGCGDLSVDRDAERLTSLMLTFDPRVREFRTQPFMVDLIDQRILRTADEVAEARKKHSRRASPRFYTPDFSIEWKHTTRSALEVKLEGWEGNDTYQDRLRLGSSILQAHGYSFAIAVLPENDEHPLWSTVPLMKKAASRRDLRPNDALVQRITELCAQQPVLMKDLCSVLAISPNLVPTLLFYGCVAANLKEQCINGAMLLSAAYGDLSHLELLEKVTP